VAGEAVAQGLGAPARNPFSVGVSEGGGQYTGLLGWIMSQQMAFERGAHAKRDDGYVVGRSHAHGLRDIVGGLGKDHRSRRRHGGVGGLIATMLFTHHQRGAAAIAKVGLEFSDQRSGNLALVHLGD
jgi:hypothetical protein